MAVAVGLGEAVGVGGAVGVGVGDVASVTVAVGVGEAVDVGRSRMGEAVGVGMTIGVGVGVAVGGTSSGANTVILPVVTGGTLVGKALGAEVAPAREV